MNNQRELFSPHREELTPAALPRASEQTAQLARVSETIRGYVLDFLWTRGCGKTFRGNELEDFVRERFPKVTAGSPLRIMRDIGGVKLIDRSKSLYRIDEVRE
jgi:hypothetical protein